MNNNGQPTGAVAGLTALVGGTGITCTPNPIDRYCVTLTCHHFDDRRNGDKSAERRKHRDHD